MTATYPNQQATRQRGALWTANEAIVAGIQDGDTDAYQDLWNANKGLVAHLALGFLHYLERRSDMDMDDLIQAGSIGLYKAARKYKADSGAKFSTYAALWIKTTMRRSLGLDGKRDPMVTAISIDAPLTPDGSWSLSDTLAAENNEVDIFEIEELHEGVRSALTRVRDDLIRCILWERHWNKQTATQTADRYGIPVQEVRGLIRRGYAILRRDSALQEWASSYGYAS